MTTTPPPVGPADRASRSASDAVSTGPSRRSLLGGLAGGALLTAAGAPVWAVDDPRPGARRAPSLAARDREVVSMIRGRRALEQVRVLSEDIGPRIGGTESETAAAEHIASMLDRYGCSVRYEPFPVADKFLAQLDDPDGQLADDICWQAGACPDAALDVRVAGSVVDVVSAEGPVWPTDPAALTGAVVIADDTVDTDPAARVQRRRDFVLAVQGRGAAALILLPADAAYPRRAQAASLRLLPTTGTTPPPPEPVATIPVVGVAQVQKRLIREDLAIRALRLIVSTEAHTGLTSRNVIGELRGARRAVDTPLVYVSGHYDSVIGAPGANDDGSGTALTMELARVFPRLRRTRATMRFALWGSEEQGLIGSRYHVAQLVQAERDRIRAVFQNDMVATSWDPATRYWLLSFDGDDNLATSSVAGAARRMGYAPQISPVTERGASDHQSFQEVGIASANFSWRGEASPALLEPPYHSPEDTIAKNVSLERLTVSLEMIGAAAYDVASRP